MPSEEFIHTILDLGIPIGKASKFTIPYAKSDTS